MWDKLAEVERRFEEVAVQLSQPEVIRNRDQFQRLSKEHKDLTELVATIRAYRKAADELQDSEKLIKDSIDPDMAAMALEEATLLRGELEGLEANLKTLLLPKDPNDEKNVILEIRAGTGGDEASLFAGELFRSYMRYAETKRLKVELMSISDGTVGGYKEVIAMITGAGAYSVFKYEKGVHRVQRVPNTETQGRIHTSTVTVAVLPEAEEIEVEILEKDLRIDVYRSGGHGGQSVNTTDSAVRITHLPTGIVVAMQDEKSQIKNRAKGMRVLRARIYDQRQQELDATRTAERRSQLGGGDRSEKIRTYNFPQSRVTDHRIGLSLYSIDAIMNGELDSLIEPLTKAEQAERLKDATS